MFDDMTLFAEEARMKYDYFADQARNRIELAAHPESYRMYRLRRLLEPLVRIIQSGRLHSCEGTDGGHGTEMGPRYGVRAIQQSIRHP